jgi:hypothetical protein
MILPASSSGANRLGCRPRSNHQVIDVHCGSNGVGAGDRLCGAGVEPERSAESADLDVPSKASVHGCGT